MTRCNQGAAEKERHIGMGGACEKRRGQTGGVEARLAYGSREEIRDKRIILRKKYKMTRHA